MPSGLVQRLPSRRPFTSGVIQNSRTVVVCAVSSQKTPSEMADPTKSRLRPALRLGGVFGFIGGFLLAYQRSSCEFVLSSGLSHGDRANDPWRYLSPFLGLVGE